MREDIAAIICTLNDEFRKTGVGGHIVMTRGVHALGETIIRRVVTAVRNYDDFTPDSDPYGEHDFGAFTIEGKKFFWKIDAYAPDMMHGSENPADPNVTVRVLTIMLASEY